MMVDYAVPTILTEEAYTIRSMRAIPNGNYNSEFECGSSLAEGVFSNQILGVAGTSVIVNNFTDKSIVMIDRWNGVVTIPPIPFEKAASKGMVGTILIEVVHVKPRRYMDDVDPTYNRYARFHKRKSKTLRKEFYRDRKITGEDSPAVSNQITWITIPNAVEKMEAVDSGVFVQEAGVVLALADTNVLFVHPDTPTSDLIDYFPHDQGVNNEFTMRLCINDTSHRFNAAFINIGGLVVNVPITRSAKDKDGIHCNRQLGTGRRRRDMIQEYYEFDDPKSPIKVFNSREAATTMGDPSKYYDHEINKVKQTTTTVKAETDLNLAEIRRQELEDEQIRKEAESMRKLREEIRQQLIQEEKEEKDKLAQEAQRKAQIAKANAEAAAAKLQEEKHKRQTVIDASSNRSKLLTEVAKTITAVVGVVLSVLAVVKLKSN